MNLTKGNRGPQRDRTASTSDRCATRGGTSGRVRMGTRGQATPPAGSFIAVSTSANHSCGVRADGSVVCWGGYSVEMPVSAVATLRSL